MSEAVSIIRAVIAGRHGAVNDLLRRYGREVVEYATALAPARGPEFAKLVEDIFSDVVSQASSARGAETDEAVREFVFGTAAATVRIRFRDLLSAPAEPEKASDVLSFEEVLKEAHMEETELKRSISEGSIRAVRVNDEMRIKVDDVPGLERPAHVGVLHIGAAERELLCLHFRLGFSPETIAHWVGAELKNIEMLIERAASKLVGAGVVQERLV